MTGDLLYALVFALVASIVLVPSWLASRRGLVARWDRRHRQPRYGGPPLGSL